MILILSLSGCESVRNSYCLVHKPLTSYTDELLDHWERGINDYDKAMREERPIPNNARIAKENEKFVYDLDNDEQRYKKLCDS